MSAVRIIDGRPALVLADRDDLDELQRVLHQLNLIEVYRGRPSIPAAVDFVRAARAAVALIDAAQVPTAELDSDSGVSADGSWITTTETARLLGIGTRAVRKRVATGTLIGRKVGGVLFIDTKEVA